MQYDYDAWGNIIAETNASGGVLSGSSLTYSEMCPFRYRGYYYDKDTGLYYLQSRYYNPEVGRFLNVDGYITTGQGVLSYNMFAYCTNNPILLFDPFGTRPDVSGDLRRETSAQRQMSFACINPKIKYPQNMPSTENDKLQYYLAENTKPNFTPRKDKRKGSENRQKSGARERNVAHPNGEEHSRVPKGNGYNKCETLSVWAGVSVAIIVLIADDASCIGIADDYMLVPSMIVWWDTTCAVLG